MMDKEEREIYERLAKKMNDYKEILKEKGIEDDLAKKMVRDYHKSLMQFLMAKQQMEEFEKGFQSALQGDSMHEMDLSDLDA